MNHHYVPRAYLRRWASDGKKVVTYVRVGADGRQSLRAYRRSTRGICFEPDLYALDVNHRANGLTLQEIEVLLGKVDEEIVRVAAALGDRAGIVPPDLAASLKWIMQTFVARSPDCLSEVATAAEEFALEHGPLIRRMISRTLHPEMRAELVGYLDPAMPRVAARAGLAAIVNSNGVPARNWYADASVTLIRRVDVSGLLSQLGLSHFPTFEDPVVQWQASGPGLIATFSITPDALVVVAQGEGSEEETVFRHAVDSLTTRRVVIFSNEVSAASPWLAHCERRLLPSLHRTR